MLKRRFANSADGDFYVKFLDDKIFQGYVCYNKLKCDKPLIVNDGTKDLCIKDNDYTWILVYPNDSHYTLTIIFDDKMNLVQWYFDIAKNVGVEKGVPYEDDLYLDVVITSTYQFLVLDEDELLDAKEKDIITENDVKLAYTTMQILKDKYCNHYEDLKQLTKHLCRQFSINPILK